MRTATAAGGSVFTRNDDWATPLKHFNKLNEIFKFDVDVCASDDNHKCDHYFNKYNRPALSQDWRGMRCFDNPPYSQKHIFLDYGRQMMRDDSQHSRGIVVNLVPAATETDWFQQYAENSVVWLLKSRIPFIRPEYLDYNDDGSKRAKSGNTKGSALVIYHPGRKIYKAQIHLVDLFDKTITLEDFRKLAEARF